MLILFNTFAELPEAYKAFAPTVDVLPLIPLTKNMVGKVLTKNNVVKKEGNSFNLLDFESYSEKERNELINICQNKLFDYIEKRGKRIFQHRRKSSGYISGSMPDNQITINNLSKVYDNGFTALKNINLNIKKGEIFAMLGPNGAGKTTLISIICGIVNPTSGKVSVDDYDIINEYRETRSRIGLVPQELTLEQFETVFNNVSYSRGLYGKKPNPSHIEKILKQLSLWDKKDLKLRQLSGGMKRRVLIAKALSHEPSILFLDEPTAGVDVELRKEMWKVVENLRKTGVTIILTTHYIEEAEAIVTFHGRK